MLTVPWANILGFMNLETEALQRWSFFMDFLTLQVLCLHASALGTR